MKNAKVLDTFALVKFFKGEQGSEHVKAVLSAARRAGTALLMTELNAGELYYVVAKKMGAERAEELLASLETIPITLLPVTWELVLAAARLKAQWPLSYAECFAVASALQQQATLVTGDAELKKVAHLVHIEWI